MGNDYFYPPQALPYPIDPKDGVKRQIRMVGAKIGGGIIIMQFISKLFIIFYRWFCQDFLENISASDLTDIFHQFSSSFLYCLYIFVPFLLIAYSTRVKLGNALRFSSLKGKSVGAMVVFGLGVFMLSNTLTFWVVYILEQLGVSYTSSSGSGTDSYTPVGIIFSIFSTAILPAIFEEFALRGIVLTCLRKYGNGFAIFGSSLIFAVMHSTLPQLPFAFLGGLVLGYITIETDSLLPAIILHGLNNSYSLASTMIRHYLPSGMANLIMVMLTLIACGAAVVAAFILLKRGKGFLTMPQKGEMKPDVISFGQKVKQLIVNFGMLPAGVWLIYKVITNGVTFFGQGG